MKCFNLQPLSRPLSIQKVEEFQFWDCNPWKINPYLGSVRPFRCSFCVLQWSVGAIIFFGFVHPHKIFAQNFFLHSIRIFFVWRFFLLCEFVVCCFSLFSLSLAASILSQLFLSLAGLVLLTRRKLCSPGGTTYHTKKKKNKLIFHTKN